MFAGVGVFAGIGIAMVALVRGAGAHLAQLAQLPQLTTPARPYTPTLDDFDLSAYSGGLCVSYANHVETIVIVGSAALILGVAALLIGQVLRRRAARA